MKRFAIVLVAAVLTTTLLTMLAGCDKPQAPAKPNVTIRIAAPVTETGLIFRRDGCSNGQCTPTQQPVSAAIARAQRSVVMLNNRGNGSGSGAYLGDGLVITCSHLFRNRRGASEVAAITVTFADGTASGGTLIAEDVQWDLALVKLSAVPTNAQSVTLATAGQARGDQTTICGFGGKGIATAAVGAVTGFGKAKGEKVGPDDTLMVSGHVIEGDSGGPIFNERGEIAAVLWGGMDNLTVGTKASRCRIFAGKWLGKCGGDTTVAIAEPVTPSESCGDCLTQVAELRAEVAELRKMVESCQGTNGKDGRDGIDATQIDVDDIIRRVKAGIRIPTSISISQ